MRFGSLSLFLGEIVGNDSTNGFDQQVSKRQDDNDSKAVEDCMEHSQLHLRCIGEHILEYCTETDLPLGNKIHHESGNQKDYYTKAVENQVHKGSTFGILSTGHTGNNRYDAGTDVGTECKIDTLVERNKPRYHHRDCDRCHHGRGLDNRRKDSTDKHQQNRIADRGKEDLDRIHLCKILHRARHHTQSDEEHTEARKDTACRFPYVALAEKSDECADTCECSKDGSGGQTALGSETECDNLRRDSSTDIGTIDDSCRLTEGHNAHIDETDDHHRGGTRRLDSRRTERTDADTDQFVVAHFGKQSLEVLTTCRFQVA